jgi:hypothetical protein
VRAFPFERGQVLLRELWRVVPCERELTLTLKRCCVPLDVRGVMTGLDYLQQRVRYSPRGSWQAVPGGCLVHWHAHCSQHRNGHDSRTRWLFLLRAGVVPAQKSSRRGPDERRKVPLRSAEHSLLVAR